MKTQKIIFFDTILRTQRVSRIGKGTQWTVTSATKGLIQLVREHTKSMRTVMNVLSIQKSKKEGY